MAQPEMPLFGQAPAPHGVETLDHGTQVFTAPGCTFGSDALLLARFSQPKVTACAADLCSGCGIVALFWHDAGHRGPCTALELDAKASALCAAAVRPHGPNGPEMAHITPLCADLRAVALRGSETAALAGSFDTVACNPPYFSGGPRSPDPRRAAARHADTCSLSDLADAAARLLHDGGRLFLCQRPARLAEVCSILCARRLEPKRLQLVRKDAQSEPWLFLLEAQKGRAPGLRWEQDLFTGNGAVRYGTAGR